MPRSRSRSRERKRRDRSREKRSRSKTKRSKSRDRREKERTRDKRSRSRDRDSRNKHHKRDRRSQDRSYERIKRDKRDSRDKRRRSSSSEERNHRSNRTKSPSSSNTSIKPIIITASRISGRAKANRAAAEAERIVDHRESFEISNEFTQEGFDQFSRDHGIDFTNIDTDEDRQALHEKMELVLKEHFAAQGKIYPPPKNEKPAINAATGFANDGSFLEQFKKMEEEYKIQMEEERKRRIAEERLKSLPLRRRGGKILKTGIVAKSTIRDGQPPGSTSADAWSIYFKEVQKYKSASCDSDAPTRPLVK